MDVSRVWASVRGGEAEVSGGEGADLMLFLFLLLLLSLVRGASVSCVGVVCMVWDPGMGRYCVSGVGSSCLPLFLSFSPFVSGFLLFSSSHLQRPSTRLT